MLIRPRPLGDELFTSWLVRLAWANAEKLHPFCHRRLGMVRHSWQHDLDRWAEPLAIKQSAAATGLPEERVFATTLASYEGVLCDSHIHAGGVHWILSVKPFYRTRYWYGQQYCPACLREDPVPYFRRLWRLSFMVACQKHGTLLVDACPHCGAPVSFHEGDYARRRFPFDAPRITLCPRCGGDFRLHAVPLADPDVVKFEQGLIETMTDGWSRLVPHQTIYGIAFFDGLHHLLRVLASNTRTRRIREHLLAEESQLGFPTSFCRATHHFDDLRVHDRYSLVRMAARLIVEWPRRFLRCLQGRKGDQYLPDDLWAHVAVLVREGTALGPLPPSLLAERHREAVGDRLPPSPWLLLRTKQCSAMAGSGPRLSMEGHNHAY